MLSIQEIKRFMEEDFSSEKKRFARQGLKYYEGEHDILNYQIYYYDADGQLQLDKFKSNIRISHPFFTELVDQQIQYMLSGDGNIIRSDNSALQTELDDYFNDDFYSEIYELLQGTVSKGFEYMYAVTDSKGKTRFECADSMGVVEIRAKDTDDKCEYYIYWYIDRIEKGKKEIKRIQVWDNQQVYFYVQDGKGKIKLDEDAELNPRPHTIYTDKKGEKFGKGFGFIPFWRLDNGRKQFSGLKPIKTLIDDYDLMACSLSNNLQDFTDALYVVAGFQGQNLDEMIQNIKAKKHIGVDGGGTVDIKTVNIPHEARIAKLELDEKNIYRFGMGFNSAQLGDGNITNIVIKSRYALLDLKCNKLEIRLKQFLRKLISVVLDEINTRNKTDYQMKDVYFVFDREVMTNAQDNATIEKTDAEKQQIQINTLLTLTNVFDKETLVQMICDILDIDYEDIKDKLPKGEEEPEKDITDAENLLNGVGANGIEQTGTGSSTG
ncbi:MAG: phage portal protein [Elusimicrobia bacterium]|nr:phage portal protein [Elusimicrobiota bacterium]